MIVALWIAGITLTGGAALMFYTAFLKENTSPILEYIQQWDKEEKMKSRKDARLILKRKELLELIYGNGASSLEALRDPHTRPGTNSLLDRQPVRNDDYEGSNRVSLSLIVSPSNSVVRWPGQDSIKAIANWFSKLAAPLFGIDNQEEPSSPTIYPEYHSEFHRIQLSRVHRQMVVKATLKKQQEEKELRHQEWKKEYEAEARARDAKFQAQLAAGKAIAIRQARQRSAEREERTNKLVSNFERSKAWLEENLSSLERDVSELQADFRDISSKCRALEIIDVSELQEGFRDISSKCRALGIIAMTNFSVAQANSSSPSTGTVPMEITHDSADTSTTFTNQVTLRRARAEEQGRIREQ